MASWGRDVRIKEAERGRGRVATSGSSSGIGGDREGFDGEGGMVVCVRVSRKRSGVGKRLAGLEIRKRVILLCCTECRFDWIDGFDQHKTNSSKTISFHFHLMSTNEMSRKGLV